MRARWHLVCFSSLQEGHKLLLIWDRKCLMLQNTQAICTRNMLSSIFQELVRRTMTKLD